MKYERTEKFKRDYRRLTPDEQEDFKRVVLDAFAPAADRCATDPGQGWPAQLRVKGVTGAPGIWEMTWSFTDPDGRATWEWVDVDGESGIRWRRVGYHSIFGDP
ncbi:MAG: hypothetical protein ACREIV_16620 [Planctomycetaceae bacterium]